MTAKERFLLEIDKCKPVKGKNSMGVSESNYNPFYLIGNCFKKKALENMELKELKNLYRLANYASEVFY